MTFVVLFSEGSARVVTSCRFLPLVIIGSLYDIYCSLVIGNPFWKVISLKRSYEMIALGFYVRGFSPQKTIGSWFLLYLVESESIFTTTSLVTYGCFFI